MPSPSRPVERAKPLLGTFVRIRVEGLAAPQAHHAISAAFGVIAQVHRLMSFHAPDSELTRLNRHAWRAPVKVHPHTRTVLHKALEIARASDGLFDPAIAPALVREGLLPAPAATRPIGRATWRDVSITPDGSVAFAQPLWLDLGGIAKGYAVDCAIALLEQYRPARICVEAGGDLRLSGAGSQPVYLDAPCTGHIPVLEIENAAVASSGSQNRPGLGPVSPHMDTRTGRPCPTGRFVTVIAPRCIQADALTKVVMAAGDAARPILARYGAQALLFEDAGWHALEEAA